MSQGVRKVSKRGWPSFEQAMRSIEAGVFDDREFDLLLGDNEERAPSVPTPKRLRPRRATAPTRADGRAGRATG